MTEINKTVERMGRSPYMNDGTIDELLSIRYGGRESFLTLSLLYDDNSWGTMTFHPCAPPRPRGAREHCRQNPL